MKRPVFIVEFYLDDDDLATSGPEGIARILRAVADDPTQRWIRDINGNMIGNCRIEGRYDPKKLSVRTRER